MEHPLWNEYIKGKEIKARYDRMRDDLIAVIKSYPYRWLETFNYLRNFADLRVAYKVGLNPHLVEMQWEEDDEIKTVRLELEELPMSILLDLYLKTGLKSTRQ